MPQRSGLLRLAACAAALSLLCGCNHFSAVRAPSSSSEAESEASADSIEDEWLDGYLSGYDDGMSDGSNAGFSCGEDSAYSVDCYPVFSDEETYESGYREGYHNKYSTGWLEGFIEGYYSVHNEVNMDDLIYYLNSEFGSYDLK